MRKKLNIDIDIDPASGEEVDKLLFQFANYHQA
jgi:hypothetical protein